MNRSDLLFLFIIYILVPFSASGKCLASPGINWFYASQGDTVPDNQFLFNGRVWRNYYSTVENDQFLFSNEFLPGTVTMRGKTYSDIMIKYDIFRDEILIPYKPVGILQLNKEMVDSFSILFKNKKYHFDNYGGYPELTGYFNILYKGGINLYVKYAKKIEKYADGGRYDKFYQVCRIYLLKDTTIYPISGKKDLFRIFDDDRKVIRNFIKNNETFISKDSPESFVPVINFINSPGDKH